jgi:hypothetical protein
VDNYNNKNEWHYTLCPKGEYNGKLINFVESGNNYRLKFLVWEKDKENDVDPLYWSIASNFTVTKERKEEIEKKAMGEYFDIIIDHVKTSSSRYGDKINHTVKKAKQNENLSLHRNLVDKITHFTNDLYKQIKNTTNPEILKRDEVRQLHKDAWRGLQLSDDRLKALGCTVSEFQAHIEETMRDNNICGEWGRYWNLDHILPLARYRLINDDEFQAACHWSNVQALPAKQNMDKVDKIEKVC